jgi:hypothetical protein
MTTIIDHRVICKQPRRYIGWPTIARTPDDVLYVVFSGDRDAHICPFGKTLLMQSVDGGESWSAPEVLNHTPLDDRDAGICACRDGTLVVSWFTAHSDQGVREPGYPQRLRERWARHLASLDEEQIARWSHVNFGIPRGHWLRRSPASGLSSPDRQVLGRDWDTPLRAPGTAPHGPIELSDGRLLFVGNNGHDRLALTTVIVAAFSEDRGKTWRVAARIPMFTSYRGHEPHGLAYLGEPHVAEVAPGRLVAMARHEERPYREGRTTGVLWQFSSEDGGATWSDPRPTEILGKPPHLLVLQDGRLLVTYGYRHPPFGQRACFSLDGGTTWDYEHEIVLRDDAPNADLGYPATVELADGTLATVYYQIDRPGELTSLWLTRWRA